MSRYLCHIGALYPTNYIRRLKTCAYCNCQFSDITKQCTRVTCSKLCGDALRFSRARASGIYIWNDERRQRNAETVKKNQANGIVTNPWRREDVK